MTKQRFNKVSDFIYLDEETFQRMLPDLIAWHKLMRGAIKEFEKQGLKKEGGEIRVNGFVWVDDEKPGVCREMRIQIKGILS